MTTEIRHHRTQATIGNRPDPCQRLEVQIPQPVVAEQEQRQRGHDQQGQQRRRDPCPDPCRREKHHGQCHQPDGDGGGVRRRVRQQGAERLHDSAAGAHPDERPQLKYQDDGADPRHEAGHHGVGHQRDVATEAQNAQKGLEETSEHHGSHHERQHFAGGEISGDPHRGKA